MNDPNQQDPTAQLLQSLPPDQLAQLLQSGTLDQKDQMLEQQLARASALRQRRMPAYGAAAGIGAGLNDALGSVREGILENRQQGNIDKRQSALQAILDALRGGSGAGGGAGAASVGDGVVF